MRWDWDYLWHFLGGAVIVAIFTPASAWWIPFVVAGLLAPPALMRERAQGRMNLHKWIEAVTWPLGGLVAALVGLIWA